MSYVQLIRQNDWGVEYFARPGEGLGPHGTSDVKKYGLPFLEGTQIRVRWPDGVETVERVSYQIQQNEIFDHGKSYPVRFELAGITKLVHGHGCWFPLDRVKVHDADIPPLPTGGEKR